MAGTQVNMVRVPVVISGTNTYEVTATCTYAGTLPDTSIFLLAINTVTDPKDDSLARVIAIQDVDAYHTSRNVAIAAGESYFRSTSVVLRYTSLETANAAWKELSNRINTLVESYDEYLEEFGTGLGGEVISYPTVDESVKNSLIAAYQNTLPAITEAEEERDEKIASCQELTWTLNTVSEQLIQAQSDLAVYTQIQAALSAYAGTYTSIYAALNARRTQISTLNAANSEPNRSYIDVQLREMLTQISLMNTNNLALDALVAGSVATMVMTLQSRVATLTSEKNAAQTAKVQCQLVVAQAQAAVDTARTVRDNALAEVRAVCAGFTP